MIGPPLKAGAGRNTETLDRLNANGLVHMPEFFASCPKGLSEVLEKEIRDLGIENTKLTQLGVFFESNWKECYRVNLSSRIASRILKPIKDFFAYHQDELYQQVSKIDFSKHFDVTKKIKVECSLHDSILHDQRFVAMKVKDAIADHFREHTGGVRPDVDTKDPDVRIHVRGIKNEFSIALDTSGESLFKRGYRMESGLAPLKENLAAGLLKLSSWDQQSPLIDPFCGSGTFLIEAALMALKIPPGSFRKRFGFQNLKNYDPEVWNMVVSEEIAKEKDSLDFKLYGFDLDSQVLKKAKANAENAGVLQYLQFQRKDIAELESPVSLGTVVTNPPYGARLGEEDLLHDTYKDFSHSLKTHFKGWNAWVLSGNKEFSKDFHLKNSRKFFVFNGAIECRFLSYAIK